MKHRIHDENLRAGQANPCGHPALHGSADSPGMPNLAGAQIPGPGTGRILRGAGGRLPDDAAGPGDLLGHLANRGWFRRLFRGSRE